MNDFARCPRSKPEEVDAEAVNWDNDKIGPMFGCSGDCIQSILLVQLLRSIRRKFSHTHTVEVVMQHAHSGIIDRRLAALPARI